MTKLQQLTAIRDRLMNAFGWSRDQAVGYMADALGVSVSTISKNLSKGQKTPMPDKSLELLSLKVNQLLEE